MKKYCILLLLLFSVFTVGCKEKYVYEHTDVIYSESINVYLKMFSSYSLSEKEVNKKDYVLIIYRTIESDLKINNCVVSGSGVSKDNTTYNLKPVSNITTQTENVTQYLKSNAVISGFGFRNINLNIAYKRIVSSQVLEDTFNYKLNENMLTLSKNELDNVNNELINEVLSSISLKYTKNNELSSSSIETKFAINSSVYEKEYHIDFQSFAVSEDDRYFELVGYYNLSNNKKDTSFTHTVTFPNDLKIKQLVSKVIYFDEAKVLHTYYYVISYQDAQA